MSCLYVVINSLDIYERAGAHPDNFTKDFKEWTAVTFTLAITAAAVTRAVYVKFN